MLIEVWVDDGAGASIRVQRQVWIRFGATRSERFEAAVAELRRIADELVAMQGAATGSAVAS